MKKMHKEDEYDFMNRFEKALEAVSKEMSPRDIEIFKEVFKDGITMTEISRRYNITASRVGQICRRVAHRFRKPYILKILVD